jgi:hypothetical protein
MKKLIIESLYVIGTMACFALIGVLLALGV